MTASASRGDSHEGDPAAQRSLKYRNSKFPIVFSLHFSLNNSGSWDIKLYYPAKLDQQGTIIIVNESKRISDCYLLDSEGFFEAMFFSAASKCQKYELVRNSLG